MAKRIDHFIWVVRLEHVERYVEQVSTLLDVEFEHMNGPSFGARGPALHAYVAWEAGLEFIAPTGADDPVSAKFVEFLETKGEGPYGFVFGVSDLDVGLDRARDLGYPVEPLLQPPDPAKRVAALSRWTTKVTDLREAFVGEVAGAGIFLGDVQYAEEPAPDSGS